MRNLYTPNYMVLNTSLPCLQLSPFRFHQKKQMKEIPLFKWQSNRHSIFLSSLVKYRHFSNHTIFRHANFIGCLSADKIKMPVRKYFCFNIPVYRNMAEEPSCRSPYHEEYIQTSVSGNSEGLCRSTYSFLSERR